MVPKLHVGYIDAEMKSGNSDEKWWEILIRISETEAGKTGPGPGPRTVSSHKGIRKEENIPLCFALNEAITHGGMASKTETS